MKTDGQLHCYKPVKKALFLNARTPPLARLHLGVLAPKKLWEEKRLMMRKMACLSVPSWGRMSGGRNIVRLNPQYSADETWGEGFFSDLKQHTDKRWEEMIEIKKKTPFVVCLPIVSLSGRTKHPCEWAHGELTIKLWKDQVELRMQIQETILNF